MDKDHKVRAHGEPKEGHSGQAARGKGARTGDIPSLKPSSQRSLVVAPGTAPLPVSTSQFGCVFAV